MKLVKTSMIACALSALIATPVLAQGAPPAKTGGAVQGKSMQGSTMGSGDEEMNAQPGAAGEKTGMKSTKGLISMRGVVPACRTQDTVSILALTAADAGRIAATAIAGTTSATGRNRFFTKSSLVQVTTRAPGGRGRLILLRSTPWSKNETRRVAAG